MNKGTIIRLIAVTAAVALLIFYPPPLLAGLALGIFILTAQYLSFSNIGSKKTSPEWRLNPDHLADSLIMTCLQGKIKNYNKECKALLPAAESANTITELFNDWHDELTDRTQADDVLEAVIAAPQMQFSETLHFKDGRVFERHTRAPSNSNQRLWVLRDITYLQKAKNDSQMHSTLLEADAARTAELAEQLYHAKDALEAKQAELTKLANTDSLTGLLNRRRFTALGQQAIKNTQTNNIWVIMMDIDHFKRINDTYGHAAGDVAIRDFSSIMTEEIGEHGFIGRMGGEEFATILENFEMDAAIKIAEKIRQKTATHTTEYEDEKIRFTASFGVAQWQAGELSIEAALDRSDQALYSAKSYGRNRVVGYETA